MQHMYLPEKYFFLILFAVLLVLRSLARNNRSHGSGCSSGE